MDILSNFKQAMGVEDLAGEATVFLGFDLKSMMIVAALVALGVFILYWLIFVIRYYRGKIKLQGKFIKSKYFEFPFKLAIAVYILSIGVSMILTMYNQFGF